MSRWQPNASDRLERAAVELFVEQGFAETTVPQITARAGLTTRTFFRHFADKREVLFAGEEELPALVARLMADAPASLGPMMLIAQGLETVAATRFEGRLEYLRKRRAVIQADEGLRERELRKLSILSEAISRGFRDRGVDDLTSTLAAQIAVTVFSVAVSRWLDQDGEQPLSELTHDTLRAVRSLAVDPSWRPHDVLPGVPAEHRMSQ
jgi:AcrR family transcriptional regulator